MLRFTPSTRPASLASLLRHFAIVAAILVVAGCSGGGCSAGCSSCSSVAPLTSGFDPQNRVENAGSVRITQSGFAFLSKNLGTLAKGLLGGTTGNGMLTFPVPKSTGQLAGFIAYTVCPNGASPNANPAVCTAELDVKNAALTMAPYGDATNPSEIHVTGTLPVRVQDVQVSVSLDVCTPTINVALNGNKACPGGTFDSVPLSVDIAIRVDQNHNHTARFGYSQITIKQIVDEPTLESNLNDDVHICGVPSCDTLCCITDLCTCALAGIGDFGPVKTSIVNSVVPQIDTALRGQIDDQLCQRATADVPCPTGTTADASMICRYPDKSCSSILLGSDGHVDLGGLLASVSPGTKGGLDFLFAAGGQDKNSSGQIPTGSNIAWGDLDPVNNGATLGLFGGAEANPLSKCVKLSSLPLPTGIPIPSELFANTIPNWPSTVPGPHLGIALSERFSNYALNGLYNSGFLCIGISTESIPLLSSGTLGLLAPSSKDLGLQREPQQVAIVIRPSSAPTVAFGNGTNLTTDPLLRIGMKQAALDFYFFSLDRFIRFMTATFDLDVPMNLSVTSAGLTPVIDKIGVSNGVVTNSQLLRDKPADLAGSIADLIGSLVGQQLGGSLSAIDFNKQLAPLGLKLLIPDTVDGMGSPGLRKLTKGTDNYLGLFAAFALATPATPSPGPDPQSGGTASHTDVQVMNKRVDPAGLKLETLRPDNGPVVDLLAVSKLDDGTRAVEFQYKVDDGLWHPFSRSRFITVDDAFLRVQGRHVIHVRSRAVGDPESLDETAAQAEVVVDAEPPAVNVAQADDGTITLDVRDRVTPDALVRYRLDEGEWSSWTLASRVGAIAAGSAAAITVEARDTEGNVGTATQSLIRGRADGLAAAGCGCTVAGEPTSGRALWALGIALAAIGSRFARKRRERPRALRSLRAPLTCAAALVVASTWAGCSCGNTDTHQMAGSTTGMDTDGGDASCPHCETLGPGLIGEYTSVAVSDSDVWVAGYSEADWDNGLTYGDLVAGKWDGEKVAWDQVDGVPSTPAPDPTMFDVTGFRGGQTSPGDDVGLWTSIAIGADKNPAIAYYDRTHKALKFARYDGKKWSASTIESKPTAAIGRYAKVLFLNGAFVVAYQSIEPGGTNGALISKVRIATSTASGGWTFEDAVTSLTTPCRAAFCGSGTVCAAPTKLCAAPLPAGSCSPACPTGQACIGTNAPACVPILDANTIDAYPDAIGDYVAIAPDGQGGVGVAYYDRTNGNLGIASKANGTWTSTIVDGQDATGKDTGDVGIGATLAIDANGDWHLAYVNGFTEALQYVKVAKGKTRGTPEIIDDGLGLGGTPFDDGQHLVGDDAHIVVTSAGEVHVSYQDATAGTLRYAIGGPTATGHTWIAKAVQQDGFAGAFSNIVVVSGQTKLVNWWRVGGTSVHGDVRFLSPP